MARANQPRDLVWSLEAFQSPETAMRFFNFFENRFVVYSASVQKLYCEYTTQQTGPEGRRRLVVLPEFKKFDTIFSKVNQSCIVESSVRIYPEVVSGKTRVMLSGLSKTEGKLIHLPLKSGLRALKMGYFDQGPVFPVLRLGDLREFPERPLPYLSLHTIMHGRLRGVSSFERRDILKAAWTGLNALAR